MIFEVEVNLSERITDRVKQEIENIKNLKGTEKYTKYELQEFSFTRLRHFADYASLFNYITLEDHKELDSLIKETRDKCMEIDNQI